MFLDIIKEPNLDRWSLLAADCITSLRSALDNFVYALAVRDSGKTSPPDHRALQFPITDTPALFTESVKRKRLGQILAATQARIEKFQPYNRPHHHLPPLLGMIRDLDDTNKHRLLTVAFQQIANGKFSFARPHGRVYNLLYTLLPLKSGEKIASFCIDPPQLKLDYKHEISMAISITHAVGPSGVGWSSLADLLDYFIAEVSLVINTVV